MVVIVGTFDNDTPAMNLLFKCLAMPLFCVQHDAVMMQSVVCWFCCVCWPLVHFNTQQVHSRLGSLAWLASFGFGETPKYLLKPQKRVVFLSQSAVVPRRAKTWWYWDGFFVWCSASGPQWIQAGAEAIHHQRKSPLAGSLTMPPLKGHIPSWRG